jgi:signal transduction histidine kinase
MADQLLLLERSDTGMAGSQHVPVDLDDVVDAVVTSRRLEDRQSPVSIDQSAVRPVQVTGDSALLEQVVRNLVDNAVDHATSEVRVGLTPLDSQAVLTVDDDGPGIPEEYREEVFLRFTRLDDSRARHRGGVGLGLAIVAGIVHAHGGTVRAEDSAMGGARLTVTLPHVEG